VLTKPKTPPKFVLLFLWNGYASQKIGRYFYVTHINAPFNEIITEIGKELKKF
jgi:hypothetical protein